MRKSKNNDLLSARSIGTWVGNYMEHNRLMQQGGSAAATFADQRVSMEQLMPIGDALEHMIRMERA